MVKKGGKFRPDDDMALASNHNKPKSNSCDLNSFEKATLSRVLNIKSVPTHLTQKQLQRRAEARPKGRKAQLGNLSVLPDELIVEVCKYLIPPENPPVGKEGGPEKFDKTRSNTLDFMRVSPKLYFIGRELRCLTQRTFHVHVSGAGYAFEGHLNCPLYIIRRALRHAEFVQTTIELDLAKFTDIEYVNELIKACYHVCYPMQKMRAVRHRLREFNTEIYITDSKYVSGQASRRPTTLPNGLPDLFEGHQVMIEDLMKVLMGEIVRVQSIRAGNVRLMCSPRSYHPLFNGSYATAESEEYADIARSTLERSQVAVEAAAYLFSGWDMKEMDWCVEFLDMGDYTGYAMRKAMELYDSKDTRRPPVHDAVLDRRCRCSPDCIDIVV
jgi:hypothetical protein